MAQMTPDISFGPVLVTLSNPLHTFKVKKNPKYNGKHSLVCNKTRTKTLRPKQHVRCVICACFSHHCSSRV